MLSEKIHSRPECRSFEIPAAQKMNAIATQTNRIGQVYSALAGRTAAERRRVPAISASSEQRSPARERARAPEANTARVSKCCVWPKFWGSPSRYVPSTKVTSIAGRVNRPTALRISAVFQTAWIAAIAGPLNCGTFSRSNSQIGIQNTEEYDPHAEKSCGTSHTARPPKNSTRQTPSVVAEPGSNQKRSQRLSGSKRRVLFAVTSGPPQSDAGRQDCRRSPPSRRCAT